ncbi:MAG: NCS2 family permease [Deltaproteobacteria bacterium]|nr:NCS2 family permease [Deltaproteobacteria bacterium]
MTEISAGLATFLSLAYVLTVNPLVLSQCGMPQAALFTATALGTIFATLIMCFVARLPFVVAPGMGLNAFFAGSVVNAMGFSWQQAAAAVFIAGCAFIVVSLSPLRRKILNEVPECLRLAVAAGIGLMIAYIGLKNGSLVVFSKNHDPNIGTLAKGPALLTVIGLAVTALCLARNYRYSILIGIIVATLIGIPLGITDVSGISWKTIVSPPPPVTELLFKMDFSRLNDGLFWAVIFTFFFMCVFDSLACFIGLFSVMGSDAKLFLPRISKAFLADSMGVVAGSLLGLSPNTTYAESGAGVAMGGRTGLAAFTVAALFVLCLFFSKLFLMVPAAAVAPALVLVGLLMVSSLKNLNFQDKSESFPAFVVIIITCLTWRLSDSLAVGWILYILMKTASGRIGSVTATVWVVGALFFVKELFVG